MLYKDLSDSRAKSSRKEIINAYVELLVNKDHHLVTVKNLCETGNISRSTFYRHYNSTADIEADIEDIVMSTFHKLMDLIKLEDFIYGRKHFLNALNDVISSDIDFYSHILFVNQNIGFLSKINTTIRDSLRETLRLKTTMSPEQIDLTLTFAVGGRVAVYKKWILNGFLPPAETLSPMLEEISSLGFDYFLDGHSK